ncbi:MAG: glycosyltransferase family 4 protein [Bacillota bacterium]|nr:glycosyltransferase family 4 protein [Bacillota bacterium]
MRILIANYRYFISGGPEIYMFNIKKLFENKGHQVVPFSVKYRMNVKTEYDKYFIEPIGGEDKVYFSEYKMSPKLIIQLIGRSFYSFEAKQAFYTEIINEKIDAVYILHHVNKISPSIINAAKKANKKVIVRLSDFFLLCPRFDFLRNGDICEACLKGSLFNAIRNKCVQNSFAATTIRTFSMYFHRLIKIYDKVDYFVTPSNILREKLIEYGFDREKIAHIPTFIDSSNITPSYQSKDYILYFGRISKEKGVEYLIRAFKDIKDKDLKLYIVGHSNDGEIDKLKELVEKEKIKNVIFTGKKNGEELANLIKDARFVVLPSIWYDNMPNVLLESFCYGKPVIASNIGCFPEVIDNGKNGLLFEMKNIEDLRDKIDFLNSRPDIIEEYGKNARKKVENRYNSENHYNQLINLLKQ